MKASCEVHSKLIRSLWIGLVADRSE